MSEKIVIIVSLKLLSGKFLKEYAQHAHFLRREKSRPEHG